MHKKRQAGSGATALAEQCLPLTVTASCPSRRATMQLLFELASDDG